MGVKIQDTDALKNYQTFPMNLKTKGTPLPDSLLPRRRWRNIESPQLMASMRVESMCSLLKGALLSWGALAIGTGFLLAQSVVAAAGGLP